MHNYPSEQPPLILIVAERPDRAFFHVLECLDQWQSPYFYLEPGDYIQRVRYTREEDQLGLTLEIHTAKGQVSIALHEIRACWQHSGALRFGPEQQKVPALAKLVHAYLQELPRLQGTCLRKIPFLTQSIFAEKCGLQTPPLSLNLQAGEYWAETIPEIPLNQIRHQLKIFFLGEQYLPLVVSPKPETTLRLGAPSTLPTDIEGRLMLLMEKMGLTIGIIDITVGLDHTHYFRGVQQPVQIDAFILAGYRSLPEDIAVYLTQIADIPSARIRRMYFGPDPDHPRRSVRPGS